MQRRLVDGLTTFVHERTNAPPSVEALLRALLPDASEALLRPLSNPQRVGDIAMVTVPPELRPHGEAIGSALLRGCVPPVRAVLGRGVCSGTFRTMGTTHLAGDANLRTRVREHGCVFDVDLARSFWAGQRATERQRIVHSLRPAQTLCDATAGVGPFAIAAARKGLRVLANDLNPGAHALLQSNAGLNKVAGRVRCFNMCARDFVRRAAREGGWSGACAVPFDVALLNLPDSSLRFLDAFVGVGRLGATPWPEERLPTVHAYCFARGDEAEAEATIRTSVHASLGRVPAATSIRRVRTVAADSSMFCVSFRLPPEVAFAACDVASENRRLELCNVTAPFVL
jgi:tRNA (guanine37-N1)-methyltransferase